MGGKGKGRVCGEESECAALIIAWYLHNVIKKTKEKSGESNR